MVYDIERKMVNGVQLSKTEWQIFEMLIEHKDDPLTANQISNLLTDKYYVTAINCHIISKESIVVHMKNINKKLNNIIQHENSLGYYIGEEIENTIEE